MGDDASALEPWRVTLLRAAAAVTAKWTGDALPIIVNRWNAGQAQKAEQFIGDLQTAVDEQSFARAMEHPETEAMFGWALRAAAETGVAAKRRMLSRVVAQAMNDDARVDEAQLFVAALRELDGPHLRALARLNAADQRADGGERAEALTQVWEAEPVPVRAALIRTGCSTATVESIALNLMFVPAPTPVTEFGRQLLTWILAEDAEGQLA
jgi:hypothetical protein